MPSLKSSNFREVIQELVHLNKKKKVNEKKLPHSRGGPELQGKRERKKERDLDHVFRACFLAGLV